MGNIFLRFIILPLLPVPNIISVLKLMLMMIPNDKRQNLKTVDHILKVDFILSLQCRIDVLKYITQQ